MGKSEYENYNINKVAALFGVSHVALHKYEEQGLISPVRDENNSYRNYTTWEIFALIQAFSFKNCGCTIRRSRELLHAESFDMTLQSISDIQQDLAREIEYKKRLLIVLDRRRKEFNDINSQGDSLRIEFLPDLDFLPFCDKFSLDNNQEVLSQAKDWVAALPFVMPFVDFRSCRVYEAGLAIAAQDKPLYGLEALKPSRTIPGHLCVTAILRGDENHQIEEEMRNRTVVQIRREGYSITEDCLAQIFSYRKENGLYASYHKCYFPILQ